MPGYLKVCPYPVTGLHFVGQIVVNIYVIYCHQILERFEDETYIYHFLSARLSVFKVNFSEVKRAEGWGREVFINPLDWGLHLLIHHPRAAMVLEELADF